MSMPVTLTRWIVRFAPLLSKRVWERAQVMLVESAVGAGQTDRDGGVASDGVRAGGPLSEVSPGAESGAVVECRRGPRVIGLGGGDVRRHWPRGDWDRRYVGTAAWREDQSQRDLSGSGAFLPVRIWSRRVACGGYVRWSWRRFPGRDGCGPYHFSRRYVPPSGIISGEDSITRRYQSGQGK